MNRLDLDKDGVLTQRDFTTPTGAVDAMWSYLAPADTNVDGRVDPKEFVAYFVRHALQTMATDPEPQGLTQLQAFHASIAAVNRHVRAALSQLAAVMRAKGL